MTFDLLLIFDLSQLAKRVTGWKTGYGPKKRRTEEEEGGEEGEGSSGERGKETEELRRELFLILKGGGVWMGKMFFSFYPS